MSSPAQFSPLAAIPSSMDPPSAAGGRTVFRRVLSRRDLILYGLVILTPTAPFPIYGIIQRVSNGHAALSYIVAMLAVLCTAASYSKMSAAYPFSGSAYTYSNRALSPYLGFFAGWAMILDYVLIPLLSVVYASLIAGRLLPRIPYPVWALAFTAAITCVNVRGIRATARAGAIMLSLMTACAALFVVLASKFIVSGYGWSALVSASGLLRPEAFAMRPLMLGAGIATVSYIGFEAISTLAEDAIDPRRDIGFATVSVCLLQTLVCVAIVYLAALAWPYERGFAQVETAILDLAIRVGGSFMLAFLTLVLMVSALASALAGQACASRLLYGMGRDGLLSRRLFAHLHPRHATPVRAIYLMAAACFSGSLILRFQLAVEILNFGALTAFVLVNLCVVRHYFIRLALRRGGYFFGNLVFPLLGAMVSSYLWISLSTKAKIAGLVWLAAGAIYLLALTRGFRVLPKPLDFTEAD